MSLSEKWRVVGCFCSRCFLLRFHSAELSTSNFVKVFGTCCVRHFVCLGLGLPVSNYKAAERDRSAEQTSVLPCMLLSGFIWVCFVRIECIFFTEVRLCDRVDVSGKLWPAERPSTFGLAVSLPAKGLTLPAAVTAENLNIVR